jgi:MFS family permease
MRPALEPLRLPRFRRLLAAYSINAAGNWLGEIALSLVIFHQTGSVLAVTAMWIAAGFLPGLAAPFVVSVAEPHMRRDLLPAMFVGEAVLFAVLAAAAAAGAPLAAVLALAFCDGLLAAAARALIKAAIVHSSRPAELHQEANALVNAACMTAAAAGPVLAGVVIHLAGPPCALLVDSASFALAAVVVAGCAGAPEGGTSRRAGVFGRLGEAIGHVRGHAALRRLLLADAIGSIFFALIIPVELTFVTETIGGSASDFAAVLAAWAAGAVLGSVLAPLLRALPIGHLVLGSFTLMAISYLGMGVMTAVGPVIAFSALGGIGNGVEGMALVTTIQERTPDRLQAQVNALIEAIHTAGPGAGFVIGGAVAALASPRAAYLVAAIGALAVVLMAARALLSMPRRTRTAPAPATG